MDDDKRLAGNRAAAALGGYRKDGTKRVRWTEEERAQVLARALELHLGGLKSGLQCMNQAADEVLPADRKRRVESTGGESMQWFRDGLAAGVAEDAKRREREARAAAKVAARQAEPAGQAQAYGQAEPAGQAEEVDQGGQAGQAPAVVVPWTGPALGDRIGGAMLDLRTRLVDELAAIIGEAIAKALSGLSAPGGQASAVASAFRPTFDKAPSPPRPKLPSVLVVGLKTPATVAIEHEFRGVFDLRFISADESKDLLRQRAGQADFVIAMVDHLSHAHVDVIKAKNANLIRQSGMGPALRSTLAGWRDRADLMAA